jgi:hypothetical protein
MPIAGFSAYLVDSGTGEDRLEPDSGYFMIVCNDNSILSHFDPPAGAMANKVFG